MARIPSLRGWSMPCSRTPLRVGCAHRADPINPPCLPAIHENPGTRTYPTDLFMAVWWLTTREQHGVNHDLENPGRRCGACPHRRPGYGRTGFGAELGLLQRVLSELRLRAGVQPCAALRQLRRFL